jgi:hypothetical protein
LRVEIIGKAVPGFWPGDTNRRRLMFKFIGGTVGVIFLIGLLVVIGILSLIF